MLSPAVARRLEALQPDTSAELHTILGQAREAVEPSLLALCASCAEAALRCEDWQPPGGGLDDRQQAFIAFTEQFVSAVSNTSHAQVARLLEYASADEVYAFVHALYVIDMALRLEIVGSEVLA